MGYTGARIAPLFSPEPARACARRLAKAGRDELLKETVQNTPIDDSPFPSRAPGTARRSWKADRVLPPVRLPREEVYETAIRSDDPITSYLEYGTGLYGPEHRAYVIRPKNPDGMLRFYSRKSGRWVLAKSVTHPGIHAQRPLATGAALAEHRLPLTMQAVLAVWIVEAEAHARAARMVR